MQAEQAAVGSPNRYLFAGWLSILMAVLYPVQVVMGVIQGIVGKARLG